MVYNQIVRKNDFGINKNRLEKLIEEATVDCSDETEQHEGLCMAIEDNVVCPFRAKVIGEEVDVIGFDSEDTLKAICKKQGKKYKVDICSLDFIKPLPKGYEWIAAYFAWRTNQY